MTPGARVAAAIEILDKISAGQAAEQALTGWARSSRFAGSKDRAAVRDHVFDVLRARRSLGDGDGRSLMMQLLARDQLDPAQFFTGEGHAPAPLTQAEFDLLARPPKLTPAAAHDIPDWLWPIWESSLGADARTAACALTHRAEVFLRVNQRNGTVQSAMDALAADDIDAAPHKTIGGCLRVTRNPRRVKASRAYTDGLIELQDASSQWAVQNVPVMSGARVLDYCAGGGGKALALADMYNASLFAHDIAPQRMRDLPTRAGRAGVIITMLATSDVGQNAPFDVTFCDAPCSGSGTWRRTPDAKWALTPERLQALQHMQDTVLDAAAPLTNGTLAYATCSVLAQENKDTVARFLSRSPGWMISAEHQRVPDENGDGFYLCLMMQK